MQPSERAALTARRSPCAGNVAALALRRQATGSGLNWLSDLPRAYLHQKQNQLQEMACCSAANGHAATEHQLRPLMADLRAAHQIKRIERAWLSDLRAGGGNQQLPLYLQHFAKRCLPDAAASLSPAMLLRSFIGQGGVLLLRQILLHDSLDGSTVLMRRTESEVTQFLRGKVHLMELLCRLVVLKSLPGQGQVGGADMGAAVLASLMEGPSGEQLVQYLFLCTGVRVLYCSAVQLLEDIFQHSGAVFQLSGVPHLDCLIQRFTDDQLVQFTRILALTLSDMDMYQDRASLQAQNRLKRSPGFVNVRDCNQDFLLACPHFLARLVALIRSLAGRCIPRYPGQTTESENWLTWIDRTLDAMVTSGGSPDQFPMLGSGGGGPPLLLNAWPMMMEHHPLAGGVGGGGGFPAASAAAAVYAADQRPPFSLQRCSELNNLVSLCYVVGLFLSGRHRRRVQRRLAELRFAEVLHDLFDMFLWRCHTPAAAVQLQQHLPLQQPQQQLQQNHLAYPLRQQQPPPTPQLQQLLQPQPQQQPPQQQQQHQQVSCECAPEVAVKIQLLRLIHSFCDHADWAHRRLLLSQSELAEMRRINADLPACDRVDGLSRIDRSLMCKKEPGLLVRIVQVLQCEPPASTFRFWLARAVESYLRCQSAYCDQVLLIRRGILSHVACTLIGGAAPPSREVVQSGFDLLAELLKFNERAVRELDAQLGDAGAERLCELADASLVDSNMFLRSVMLSIDHFARLSPASSAWSARDSCLLGRWAADEAKAGVAYKMFRLLCLHSLTQENVSCLNTGLVVLIYAHRARKLPIYLEALKRADSLSERQKVFPTLPRPDCVRLKPIMENLLDLLSFWMEHYLNKDRDCSALEKSSRIVFDEWRAIVNTLISPSADMDTGVAHYL